MSDDYSSPSAITSGGVAVVTGAASGIGAAMARALADRRMRLVLCDVSLDGLAALVRTLPGETECVTTHVDVSDFASFSKVRDLAIERFGQTNLLVNNAGIEATGLAWEIAPETWNRLLAVNLNGVFNGVRVFTEALIDSAPHSHILNVSSIGGLGAGSYQSAYITSKHAVLAFTECLHHEFSAEKIDVGVSALLPGPVSTEIFTSAGSADTDGPGQRHLQEMRALLQEHGMDPDSVAQIAINGILARSLWIHTHPELSDAFINRRANALIAREYPDTYQ